MPARNSLHTIFARHHVFALLLLAGLALGAYGAFQSRFLIAGPTISIAQPADGALVTEPATFISGTALHIARITLNDRPIFVDEQGNFSELLLLPRGYTILTVTATDRFGRTRTEVREIVRK